MSKLLSVRLPAVAALLAVVATVAQANEGPETNLEGANALFMLLGGVAALGVVVWLMTKVIGKMNAPK
jgi:hypothetical protein